jgi:hypothetical protein
MLSFFPSLSLSSHCVMLVPVDSAKLGVGVGSCGRKLWFWVGTRSGFPVGVGSFGVV